MIEKLINMFDNNDAKKIILSSYALSQRENKELSDEVFQQLLLLKIAYPDISIKINRNLSAQSKYSYPHNTIYLNGEFNESTFFHELTHLLSCLHFNLATPKEYNYFKENFLASKKIIL